MIRYGDELITSEGICSSLFHDFSDILRYTSNESGWRRLSSCVISCELILYNFNVHSYPNDCDGISIRFHLMFTDFGIISVYLTESSQKEIYLEKIHMHQTK